MTAVGTGGMVAAGATLIPLVPTFCRHNRFIADCPICSKGTVLDQSQAAPRRSEPSSGRAPLREGGRQQRRAPRAASVRLGRSLRRRCARSGSRGCPAACAWPPGGGGQIERTAPVLAAQDLPDPARGAAAEGAAGARRRRRRHGSRTAEPGASGVSAGRSGELRDELRVERVDDARVRVARWIMRPNRGWELQEAPVMLPPERFARRSPPPPQGRARSARGRLCVGRSED